MVDQRAVEAVAREPFAAVEAPGGMFFAYDNATGVSVAANSRFDAERTARALNRVIAHHVAAARPLIMAEAAGICEDRIPMPGNIRQTHGTYAQGCFDCAQAIRHAATPADPHEGGE